MTLEAEQVAVRYAGSPALAPTTLASAPGELVALIGPNGAGKSSLLKAIAGLVPHTGRVRVHGHDCDSLDSRSRARTIAYLPQAPVAHWPMRVRDVVALGRLPHRSFAGDESDADREAIDWALRVTDSTALATRGVDTLSVGERSRVLLARALAVGAPVLLVDEPTAALDPYHQLEVMELLRAYAEQSRGTLVIAVLHDLQLAARFATRVALLSAGTLVADGKPDAVLDATTLRRYYRIEAYIARHAGEPLIVPWRRVE
jgi:iron complex transport system ATP-binding protein